VSRRERPVFIEIGQGIAAQEIADSLGLAVSTIETYRERLKTRLKVSNGIALTRCAILWV
jgi:DNA-binding NarL/FixJ family response regulator